MVYDKGNYRHTDGSGITPMDSNDMQQLYRQAVGGADLLKNLKVSDGENGSHFLGMTVSKPIKVALEVLYATAIPLLSRYGGEMIYTKLKDHHGARTALIAENVVRWGMIGAKPVMHIFQAGGEHSQRRDMLRHEFADVAAATKATPRNNEVMRTAFHDAQAELMTDLKLLAADLPTFGTIALLGAYETSKGIERYRDDLAREGVKVKPRLGESAHETHVRSTLEQQKANEQVLKKLFAEETNAYLTQMKAAGTTASEAELLKEAQAYARTMVAETKEELKRIRDAENNDVRKLVQSEQERKYGDFMQNFMPVIAPVVSVLSQQFTQDVERDAERRRKHPNAWKMIKHLKEEMNSGDADRESIKHCIIEIFQQHERDRMPARLREKDKDGKPLNPLGKALVDRLSPAAELIAEYISTGLDPYALVNLVGENMVIKHEKNGGRTFVEIGEVEKNIRSLKAVLNTGENMKHDEFFADFSNPVQVQELLKSNLKELKGAERSFFVSLFPEEILLHAGMRKKDIIAERKAAHEHLYDNVAAAATRIVGIATNEPEKLKAMGLAEQEIQTLRDLVAKLDAGDIRALETAVDGKDKTVVAAVRKGALYEQMSGDADTWKKRVSEGEGMRKKLADAVAAAPARDNGEVAGKPFAERELAKRRDGDNAVGTYVE